MGTSGTDFIESRMQSFQALFHFLFGFSFDVVNHVSFLNSFVWFHAGSRHFRRRQPYSFNQCAFPFPGHNARQHTGAVMSKTRSASVIPRQADGREIHHAQFLVQNLIIGQVVVFYCGRIKMGIGRVNAIYLGCLQNSVSFNFNATQTAAESVVKNGLPVPALKMTTSPSLRSRTARRRS